MSNNELIAPWVQLFLALAGVMSPMLIVGISMWSIMRISKLDIVSGLNDLKSSINGLRDEQRHTTSRIDHLQDKFEGARDRISKIEGWQDASKDYILQVKRDG